MIPAGFRWCSLATLQPWSKKLNNTVTFARTNVDTELDGGNVAADGAIPLRGTFVLPSATTKLALGPLNAATIKLTVAEPSALAGTATYVEDGIILDVTQSFKVKIDNIAPLGIGGSGSASSQGTLVGPNCETTVTSAHLTGKVSPLEPEDPDIFLKGSMSGKYTIPAFKNCGLLTPVLTALVSGPDNPLNVNLTLPYVAPTSSVAKTMMAKVQAD